MKKLFKILATNIALLLVLLVTPSFLYKLYTSIKVKFISASNSSQDNRAFYPPYSNKEYSVKLMNELGKLSTEYKSFVGWRSKKVNFKYTKINGPYNSRVSDGEAIEITTMPCH